MKVYMYLHYVENLGIKVIVVKSALARSLLVKFKDPIVKKRKLKRSAK